MERTRASDPLVLPRRFEPVSGRPVLSMIDAARRIVRACLQTPPRMAAVSSAWLREHEIESSKRGQE
jgi:hypothetical protein